MLGIPSKDAVYGGLGIPSFPVGWNRLDSNWLNYPLIQPSLAIAQNNGPDG